MMSQTMYIQRSTVVSAVSHYVVSTNLHIQCRYKICWDIIICEQQINIDVSELSIDRNRRNDFDVGFILTLSPV